MIGRINAIGGGGRGKVVPNFMPIKFYPNTSSTISTSATYIAGVTNTDVFVVENQRIEKYNKESGAKTSVIVNTVLGAGQFDNNRLAAVCLNELIYLDMTTGAITHTGTQMYSSYGFKVLSYAGHVLFINNGQVNIVKSQSGEVSSTYIAALHNARVIGYDASYFYIHNSASIKRVNLLNSQTELWMSDARLLYSVAIYELDDKCYCVMHDNDGDFYLVDIKTKKINRVGATTLSYQQLNTFTGCAIGACEPSRNTSDRYPAEFGWQVIKEV